MKAIVCVALFFLSFLYLCSNKLCPEVTVMIGYWIGRTLNKSPLFRGQFVCLQILSQILFIPQSSLILLPEARKYNVQNDFSKS
jgi:hypothetical protein